MLSMEAMQKGGIVDTALGTLSSRDAQRLPHPHPCLTVPYTCTPVPGTTQPWHPDFS